MSNERIQKAQTLVERYPDNDLARFSLAQAYVDANEQRQATAHLRTLAARKPEWMVVQILLGKCLQEEGNCDEARAAFETAHRLAVQQHHDGPREELEALLQTLSGC